MLENTLNIRLTSEQLKNHCKILSEIQLFDKGNNIHRTNNQNNNWLDMDSEENLDIGSCSKSSYIFDLENTTQDSHSKSFTTLTFNIRSLTKNFEQFCTQIINTDYCIDIITLTETWLTNESNIEDFIIEGYHTPIVQNRISKAGGGVLIYLHERFTKFHIRKDLSFKDEFNHCLTVEYTLNHMKNNLITVCYRSPSDTDIEHFLHKLEDVLQKSTSFHSTITGDFNFNLINYQQHKETNDYYNMFTCVMLTSH